MPNQAIVLLSCRDRPGIVASVTTTLFKTGCNILKAQQYGDLETNRFFMRVLFSVNETSSMEMVSGEFKQTAMQFDMSWSMRAADQRPRVMLVISRSDHCLNDILYRWRSGELCMDIVGIIANHPLETYDHLNLMSVPFHYLPTTKETKLEQEDKMWALIKETHADLVVLARYMQVLSPGLVEKLSGRCINIHHSFLPGFKGAKPYHQAHSRGVKLIGATAHYVTTDLDEGPIIEQDVERVSHQDSTDSLVRKGKEIEQRVLSRAIAWHLAGRVALNGSKTVVFRD